MIKYFCNLCKQELNKSNMMTLQTKEGETVKTFHLHKTCLADIDGICKAHYVDKAQLRLTLPDTKSAEKPVKETSKQKKTAPVEKIKLTDAELEEVFNSFDKTAENTEVTPVPTTKTFNVKIDNLPERLVDPTPRDKQTTRRLLLCFYKGMSLKEISELMNMQYATVSQKKLRYACKEIAFRHQLPKRMEEFTCRVIDEFISKGSVASVALALQTGDEKVEDIIKYYTGI